jgi:hypothetical protein
MNTIAQTPAELVEIWEKEHVTTILPSNVRHKDLQKYLEGLKKIGLKVDEVGRSYANREIYQIEFGSGPLKVFLWSQMHGDEPTATSALIDMFTVLQTNRDKDWVKKIESALTIRAVPMLNPDGAEFYQRRNLQGIDINRDAQSLQTPEANLLKKLGADVFKTSQLEEKAEQLRSAWLMRARQLEPFVKNQVKPSQTPAIEPASVQKAAIEKDEAAVAAVPDIAVESPAALSQHGGSDPRRLAETAGCSSTVLGDARKCLLEPVALKDGTYAFKIKPRCGSGVIAAIKTYDEDGRCIRRVVPIAPHRRSEPVMSSAEPAVLDAIRNRGQNTFECYYRRHENISCNGKIDYDALSSRRRVAEVRSEEMPLSPAPRKKRKHISEKTETEQPSLIGRVSKGIKNLFGGGE